MAYVYDGGLTTPGYNGMIEVIFATWPARMSSSGSPFVSIEVISAIALLRAAAVCGSVLMAHPLHRLNLSRVGRTSLCH
jgi:hypothetical protein